MKEIIILMICVAKLFADTKHDLNLKFFQNDYHVVPEWFKVVSYDKNYVKDLVASVFKYNRTVAALNVTATYNVNLGNQMEIVTQAYKFASNEYREFPLRMQFNYCQAVEQNSGGLGKLTKCRNFSGCPLVKGRKYHSCYWTPDESLLPPYIPSGKYMMELQGLYNSTELYILRAYATTKRPEV